MATITGDAAGNREPMTTQQISTSPERQNQGAARPSGGVPAARGRVFALRGRFHLWKAPSAGGVLKQPLGLRQLLGQ